MMKKQFYLNQNLLIKVKIKFVRVHTFNIVWIDYNIC